MITAEQARAECEISKSKIVDKELELINSCIMQTVKNIPPSYFLNIDFNISDGTIEKLNELGYQYRKTPELNSFGVIRWDINRI